MTDSHKEALRLVIAKLARVPLPGFENPKSGRRKYVSQRYIADKHGFNETLIPRLLNGDGYLHGSGYLSPGTAARIVRAVADEAAKAGVEFPGDLFTEFLAQCPSPSNLPSPPAGEGGASAPGEGELHHCATCSTTR